ncbi:MAG TPA: barstar family protein [Rhodanobacteraceae bacterium]
MPVRDFSIDLTDLSACGVYYVGEDDIAVLAQGAGERDFNVHHVDLAGCTDQSTFAARLAAGLSLPDTFGRDWDTLVGYLKGMDGLPSRGHVVLLVHPEQWRAATGARSLDVLDTLEEIAHVWSGEGVAFFVFLAQDAEPAQTVAA